MDGHNTLGENESGGFTERFVDHFKFDFDTVEDVVREAMGKGKPLQPIIAAMVDEHAREMAMEAVWRTITIIADAKQPKLVVDYIVCITGGEIAGGQTNAEMARKHGITKQAFSQGAAKLAKEMGIKPSRRFRTAKAKASMAAAYQQRIRKARLQSGKPIQSKVGTQHGI